MGHLCGFDARCSEIPCARWQAGDLWPHLEQGLPTAPGNLEFDRSLRARNPAWGIRALEDIAREAQHAGLRLRTRIPMPANNLLLVFQRAVDAAPAGPPA